MLALTFACVVPPEVVGPHPGTLHEDQTFEHGGVTRTYHFYEAADHDVEDRPLVLVLHGGGGKIDDILGLGSARWPLEVWLDIAAEDRVHVLVPQGVDSLWDDCRTECLFADCEGQDDLGFLAALVDDVSARYGVDASRRYVMGESNGGFLALSVAQVLTDRFAAAGAVSALQPTTDECGPSDAPISVMFQHGTRDGSIPYEGGPGNLSAAATVDHWLAQDGCDPVPTTTPIEDRPGDDSTATLDTWSCPASGTEVAFYTGGHAGRSDLLAAV
jgi:polyhydroxybutyrate depolymerase